MAIATGGVVSSDVFSGFLLQGKLMLFKEENNVHFYVLGLYLLCCRFFLSKVSFLSKEGRFLSFQKCNSNWCLNLPGFLKCRQ